MATRQAGKYLEALNSTLTIAGRNHEDAKARRRIHGLDLEDQLIGDDEIEFLIASKLAAVVHRELFFAFERDVVGAQFDSERARVHDLQKPRAEVNRDATPDGA